jgi:hypothetical protein
VALLFIILGLLFILILIITARIRIYINTDERLASVHLGRIASANMNLTSGGPSFSIRALFARFRINTKGFMNKAKENAKPHRKRKKSRSIRRGLILFRALWKALKVKRIYGDFDTGDYPTNAVLIPLLIPLNIKNTTLRINFEDRNYFECIAETRIIRILWNVLLSYIN